jgi:hypothetical protein
VARALGKVSQALQRIAKEAHRPHSSIISDWIYAARPWPRLGRAYGDCFAC